MRPGSGTVADPSLGWNAFIKRDRLLNPAKGFCVDGRVIFEAEIYKSAGTTSKRVDDLEDVPATLHKDFAALFQVHDVARSLKPKLYVAFDLLQSSAQLCGMLTACDFVADRALSSQRFTRFASASQRRLIRAGSCCWPAGLQAELLTQNSRKVAMRMLQDLGSSHAWKSSSSF